MPVTVALSSSEAPRGATLSAGGIQAVRDSLALAIQYARYGAQCAAHRMSAGEEAIFEGVFLTESDGINCVKAMLVLNKSYVGLSDNNLTIKLAEGAYVKQKFGLFGGPKGSIHVPLAMFQGAGRQTTASGAWTILHEATHKFADTEDIGDGVEQASKICYLDKADALNSSRIAYRNPGLRAADALRNADSFTAFAVLTHRLKSGQFRPQTLAAA